MTTTAATAQAPSVLPSGHPVIPGNNIGVLLVNLGTPDATDYWSMWRYLREFLSDPRVIELNKAIWYPILYGLVLTTRPQKSGKNYDTIWNREKNELPLRTITRAQTEALAAGFKEEKHRRRLGDALRKSTDPSGSNAGGQAWKSILTFPLYPQYSGDDDGDGERQAV